ncbi:MAG: EI24 domain-containing protein [Terrimesophilobacter sp.]
MIAEPSTNPLARRGAIARFFGGVACLFRGFRLWGTSPRLMVLGAVPAIIVGACYTAAIVILVVNLATVAGWITPFADGFAPQWRDAVRVAAGVAVLLACVLVAVFTFAALTLAVGDPFYERIWREVERRAGQAPTEPDKPALRQLMHGIGNALRLLAITVLLGVLLLVGGVIPVLGQSVVPVLGIGVGGWILALELTGFAFDARGLTVRQRRRMLSGNRAGALGFGIATYLLFLVPLAAVVTMPAAVAGATLLARGVLAEGAATVPRRP